MKKAYLVAGGNKTLLIDSVGISTNEMIIEEYLGVRDIEQIGFISSLDSNPRLEMMGGELSINTCVAFGNLLAGRLGNKNGSFVLKTDCGTSSVEYSLNDKFTSVEVDLAYNRDGICILFDSIGYYVDLEGNAQVDLKKLCQKYQLPAFGLVQRCGGVMYPCVYVKETDSTIDETACGSGSVAFSLVSGISKVKQPTGENILVENLLKNRFRISSVVEEVDL